jgi:glucokinase
MRPGLAIGLDVGGTKIAGGLVRIDTGEVLEKRVVPTRPELGGEAVLAATIEVCDELRAGSAVDAVGIGVAELVDPIGQVKSSHLIAWQDLPVTERFAGIAPVTIEADVRAAALAEARYGAGRNYELFAYVSVGTGISSSLVMSGRPFTGARGNALVLASSPLTVECHHCGEIASQTLEEYAGGPGIAARYSLATNEQVNRAEDVFALAAHGDKTAERIIRASGEALGNSIGFLVNVVDPEAVIVGGGLGLAGGPYWECLVRSTREHIWSDETRPLPILPAALGPDAGLIGAAVAAFDALSSRATPIAAAARR